MTGPDEALVDLATRIFGLARSGDTPGLPARFGVTP
jgi:hypothetical protein